MPVVSDFKRIIGDDPEDIGSTVLEIPFETIGRSANHDALLVFSVRGLNTTVPVKVNNVTVGALTPNATQTHWFTQMVYMGGDKIKKEGNNELQLESNDPFKIRQVTCFFGQST